MVKETLNAESKYTNNEEDGKAEHHINQYIIKDEIGRGSFGAVHLAVDQYGKEYVSCAFSLDFSRKIDNVKCHAHVQPSPSRQSKSSRSHASASEPSPISSAGLAICGSQGALA